MTEPAEPTTRRRLRRRFIALVVAAVLLGIVAMVAAAWRASPDPADLSARVDRAIAAAGGARVRLSAIPVTLREAVVATEDERFYRHHGIDTIGVLRAVAYDVTHLSAAQGASTITEQLAKVLYLNGNDGSPWRKLLDAVDAFRIEERFSKETILESYLNIAYFGHGATGISVASERFFGLPPARLDLAQASLLAGLIQSPTAYDPFEHPSAARARQIAVLRSMVRNGFIDREEGADVLERPLALRDGSALAPVTGVSLAPGSLVSGTVMLVALALLAVGIAGVFFLRRAWRWAAAAFVIAGVIAAARALRVA